MYMICFVITYHCTGIYKGLSHVYTCTIFKNFSLKYYFLYYLPLAFSTKYYVSENYPWHFIKLCSFSLLHKSPAVWLYHSVCIDYLVYRHLCCFLLLNSVNNTTVNVFVYFSWWPCVKVCLGVESVAYKMFKWLSLQNTFKFVSKNCCIMLYFSLIVCKIRTMPWAYINHWDTIIRLLWQLFLSLVTLL